MDKRPILVTSYVNPDLDGVAGTIAYAEFLSKTGKDVVVGWTGVPHGEARFVMDRFDIEYPLTLLNDNDFDEVILVDVSDLIPLEGTVKPEKVIEIIDHRKVHEAEKFPNAKTQLELVGAAATLIAEKFMQNNMEISQKSAILLYGAIISNTFNFKAGLTTDRDKIAAKWLNETAKLPEDFWRQLFLAKSDMSGPVLAERMEGDLAWFVMGSKKVGIAQIEMIGVRRMIKERESDILQILDKIKKEIRLDYIFMNTVELEDLMNFFVARDEETKKLLEKVIEIKFEGNVAERSKLIMRKQIVPLLKDELEK